MRFPTTSFYIFCHFPVTASVYPNFTLADIVAQNGKFAAGLGIFDHFSQRFDQFSRYFTANPNFAAFRRKLIKYGSVLSKNS